MSEHLSDSGQRPNAIIARLPAGHFLGHTLNTRALPGLRLTETIYAAGLRLPRVKLDPKVVEPYVGRYQSDANFFRPNAVLSIEKQGDNLALSYFGTSPVPLTPLSHEKFYDRTFGASVTFVKGTNGEVTHFIYKGTGTSYELKRIRN